MVGTPRLKSATPRSRTDQALRKRRCIRRHRDGRPLGPVTLTARARRMQMRQGTAFGQVSTPTNVRGGPLASDASSVADALPRLGKAPRRLPSAVSGAVIIGHRAAGRPRPRSTPAGARAWRSCARSGRGVHCGPRCRIGGWPNPIRSDPGSPISLRAIDAMTVCGAHQGAGPRILRRRSPGFGCGSIGGGRTFCASARIR